MSNEEDWGAEVEEQEKKIAAMRLPADRGDSATNSAPVARSSTHAASAVGDTSAASSVVAGENVNGNGASASGNSEQTEGDGEDPAPSRADVSLMNKRLHSQLVDIKSDIEILRKDPKSPLYHVKSFEALNLKPELLRGIYDMKFHSPSKIQESTLPALLADPPTNMIAQSQSGTGKTAAFVLTMLSRVDSSHPYPQCLCLAPTYELALQIGDVTKQMAKFMNNLSIVFAVRGERVEKGCPVEGQIVIGTPGTVLDWCTKQRVMDMKKINVFVLDEADVMIDTQGHQDQSIRIQRQLRKDCQLLLFSATYDDPVMKFAENIVPNALIMRLKREEQSLDNIKQYYIECSSVDDKFAALSNIYGSISIGQSMIFCHTKRTALWLAEKMSQEGLPVALLTGDLTVEQRAAVIGRFRAGKEKVLITTNVSARGIDVEQVTVVVNFDMPIDHEQKPDFDTYIHRIGRTGRFGKRGLAINMVDGTKSRYVLRSIEDHFGRKCLRLDAMDMDEIEKIAEH